MVIKTWGIFEESLNNDCKPSTPKAAPKVVPNSLNELPNELACQSTEAVSTTPIGIATNVVTTMPIKIAPRTLVTTKIVVKTNPITAKIIAGLSKFPKAGTILEPFTTPFWGSACTVKLSKPAFFNPT